MKNYETAYEWDRIEPSVVTGLDVLPAIPPVNITFKTFKTKLRGQVLEQHQRHLC